MRRISCPWTVRVTAGVLDLTDLVEDLPLVRGQVDDAVDKRHGAESPATGHERCKGLL